MKILILSDSVPPESFGGAGIIAFMQAHELAQRGHIVNIITTVQQRDLVGLIEHEGVVIHRLYANYNPVLRAYASLYNPQTVSEMKKIILNFSPDIVHAHNVHQFLSYHALYIGRQYAKKVFLTAHDAMLVHYGKVYPKVNVSFEGRKTFNYKISIFYQLRNFWRQWNPFRNLIIHCYLKNVDKILSVSFALREALTQNGIRNVEVLHNGINLNDFSPTIDKVRVFKEKHHLNGKKVMFFGGRLGKAKGGDKAIELLIRIHKVLPNVVLLIAGKEDAYTKTLRKTVEANGVNSCVKFTGWLGREEVAVAYTASDIVLCLSKYLDPFPTVNIEAMAASKPVVGTCFGGTPEAIIDCVNGYIVDPLRVEDIERKTLLLLSNPDLAQRMGIAGKKRLETLFLLSKQVNKLEIMYQDKI